MTGQELLQRAQALNERNEPYAIVTVVRVAAPTSAYVGAQAIVTRDGSLVGWIGGGCAIDTVVARAKEALANDRPILLRIANDGTPVEPGTVQHSMACASNGAIELFIQPYSAGVSLCVLGDTVAAREARHFAERLGIRLGSSVGEAAVVLIATQGTGDAEALESALRSPAQHVMMIASRRKAEALRQLMRMRGVEEARLNRLQAPAGPDAGAKTPTEIALVAMTGVLAALRHRDCGTDTGDMVRTADPTVAASASDETPAEMFINPVCGVAVSVANALHVETYDGERYYFCCDGCWVTFRQDPEKYAAIRHSMNQGVPA